jgi:hypothetical protein
MVLAVRRRERRKERRGETRRAKRTKRRKNEDTVSIRWENCTTNHRQICRNSLHLI